LGGSDPVSGAFFAEPNAALTGAAACAAPYFNNDFSNCDWSAGNGQPFGPWFGLPGANELADSLAIRDLAAVPEPGTLGLIGLGLLGLGAMKNRRRMSANMLEQV
jgi:hypothetical protein